MKSNMKRFLGILLAALMVVTMLPAVAFAEDAATVTPNAFTVGGETYLLTGASETVNGKTYYQLLNASSLYSAEGDYGGYNFYVDETISTDSVKYIDLNFRSQYGNLMKSGVSTGVSTMNNDQIEAKLFPSATFGDYLLEREWVHSTAWPWNDATVKLATIGTVGTLKSSALKTLISTDVASMNFGKATYAMTYDFNKWNSSAYMTYVTNAGATNQAHYFKSQTDLTYASAIQGCFFGAAYVSEDFFKNTHIALETMGENVKAMLKANFNTLDLAPAGYTEAELDELGIEGVPCPEGITFVAGNKTYVLMDVKKEINNKTYWGVLSTESLNTDWNKNAMHLNYQDGKVYGDTGDILVELQTRNPDSDVRKNIQDYVTKFDGFGSYIAPATTEWNMISNSTTRVYYKGSVGVPKAAELIAVDAKYPLTYATNNMGIVVGDLGEWAPNFYYMNPLVHDGETLKGNGGNADINKSADSKGSNNAAGTWYFMTYVSEDFFLDNKLDIATTSAGVRELLGANYYQRDFNADYNAAEFEALGILAQPVDPTTVLDWSPDYVKLSDGTRLLYNGADGDYLGFTIAADFAGTSSENGVIFTKDAKDPLGNDLDNTNYGEYYLTGSSVSASSGTSLDTKALAALSETVTKNLRVTEWEAGNRYTLNTSTFGQAKSKTYFSLPSRTEMTAHASYLASLILDNTNGISSSTQNPSKYSAPIRTAGGYSYTAWDAQDNAFENYNNGVQYNTGSVFPTFYVHKDFLKEMKVDVKTIGANVKALFPANFVKSDFEVAYTDEEFEFLGVKAYNEEVKPEAGTSNSFVVGGENYLISSNIVEENGKKYFLVMNSTHLATNQGPYGRIEETVLDEEASTDTTKIFSDFKLGANYGDLEKTPTQTFKGSRSMADEYQDIYFPSSVFGDNLKMHDWQMATGWTWSDGNLVDVYHRAYMGLPTVEEVNAFNAIDPLSTQYTELVETRKFTDNWNWKRMHLANLNGGATGSGSVVSADNFAYKENGQGKFFFVAYVSEDFFKGTDIDMTTAGDGFKSIVKANFERAELTGWTKANLDLLFAGYDGEGLGLEVAKTATGAEVIVHNNGAEAAGKDLLLIVASYDAIGMVDVKTVVLEENVSAGAKTSAIKIGVDVAGATEVKAMLWEDLLDAKPIANVVSAQ